MKLQSYLATIRHSNQRSARRKSTIVAWVTLIGVAIFTAMLLMAITPANCDFVAENTMRTDLWESIFEETMKFKTETSTFNILFTVGVGVLGLQFIYQDGSCLFLGMILYALGASCVHSISCALFFYDIATPPVAQLADSNVFANNLIGNLMLLANRYDIRTGDVITTIYLIVSLVSIIACYATRYSLNRDYKNEIIYAKLPQPPVAEDSTKEESKLTKA